jgi:hypothetical protein
MFTHAGDGIGAAYRGGTTRQDFDALNELLRNRIRPQRPSPGMLATNRRLFTNQRACGTQVAKIDGGDTGALRLEVWSSCG